MVNVLVSTIHYPLTMARYFINAFERRDDVKLTTAGPFTGMFIPWGGGMQLDSRHVYTPTIPLPKTSIGQTVPSSFIESQVRDQIDIWIDIDAGWCISNRPSFSKVVYVQIQTDPHVLKHRYDHAKRRNRYDISYCMQTPYISAGEKYLPYAYDPKIHYSEPLEKEYDTCIIGLAYNQRMGLIRALEGQGITCRHGIGIVYDEYRREYNKSRIALSWSSLQDLPARVWEAFGMQIPLVSNRVPDLNNFFKENVHYMGFSGEGEAVESVKFLLEHPEQASQMASCAYDVVKDAHTWDNRVQTIMEDCGYG